MGSIALESMPYSDCGGISQPPATWFVGRFEIRYDAEKCTHGSGHGIERTIRYGVVKALDPDRVFLLEDREETDRRVRGTII